MKRKPHVSVIIPTYNSVEYLSETIESVLSQTFRDFEVVVIDDGSTDGTVKLLSSYREKIVVLTQQNKGIPAARNAGIKACSGELIAFLDHDDLWNPEKLQRQVDVFGCHPAIGICFTNYAPFGEMAPYRTGFEEAGRRLYEIPRDSLGLHAFKINSPSLLECMVRGGVPCWTSTVMVRAECLETVGPFDEELLINDDTQMWFRFAKLCSYAYVDSVLVRQRIRASSTSSAMSTRRRLSDSIKMFQRLGTWIPLSGAEREAIEDLLAALWRSKGYLDFSEYYLPEARVSLRNSLRAKWSAPAFLYYLLTFFPKTTVEKLRVLKQGIVAAASR